MKQRFLLPFLFLCGLILIGCATNSSQEIAESGSFTPGEVWKDTDGNTINAHGGGILYHDGVYYWYGEFKGDSTYKNPNPVTAHWDCYRTEAGGVSCYSSTNLYDWKFEGVVLKPEMEDTSSELHYSNVLERPKVLYNDKTGKFVMWLHVDSDDYGKAAAGVAVSDTPNGEFTYLGSMRPHGAMSRDMTLYKDEDGKGYMFYSSEENATLYISLLTDDYLDHAGPYTRNFIEQYREAPAVFKHEGKYYLLSSGCTGWDPNQAEIAVADSIMGNWEVLGDPCKGVDADKTFYAQSTHILPVEGKENVYIAMFDRWKKLDLIDSRYVWLPISFEDDQLVINWQDEWSY